MCYFKIYFLTLLTGLFMSDSKGNLALNASAVQSSLGNSLGDARHAVDGNTDSDFIKNSCTHSKAEHNPWWRVNLGNVYNVHNVTITNRGDCCIERLQGAQIRVGDSLDNNGNNNALVATILTAFNGTQTFSFDAVNGRYVNIFLPGNERTLTLCEVQVFGETALYVCDQMTFALLGEAVQSSTYESSDAQKAVDGYRNPIFSLGSCSATNEEKDPWWRVDLFYVYKITRVRITNRGDCCAERINGAQIRIGNSLENNGNNNALAATVDNIPAGATKTFAFIPVEGRYVNLYIPGRIESLTLCEVEVFVDAPPYFCVPRNLALFGEAVQSSTYESSDAQKAVDGNRNPIFSLGSCSATTEEMDPWWRVDLLDVYKITRVSITNRGDCCAERIYGVQIRIGNSLENNGNNNALAKTVDSSLRAGDMETYTFNPVKGRYVNLYIPGRIESLTLCEVEVFTDYVE